MSRNVKNSPKNYLISNSLNKGKILFNKKKKYHINSKRVSSLEISDFEFPKHVAKPKTVSENKTKSNKKCCIFH